MWPSTSPLQADIAGRRPAHPPWAEWKLTAGRLQATGQQSHNTRKGPPIFFSQPIGCGRCPNFSCPNHLKRTPHYWAALMPYQVARVPRKQESTLPASGLAPERRLLPRMPSGFGGFSPPTFPLVPRFPLAPVLQRGWRRCDPGSLLLLLFGLIRIVLFPLLLRPLFFLLVGEVIVLA